MRATKSKSKSKTRNAETHHEATTKRKPAKEGEVSRSGFATVICPWRTFPWQAFTTWVCQIAGRGASLGIHIIGVDGRYVAMALAAPSNLQPTAQAFLDHHAHHMIGESYDDLESAMDAAETYAIEWRKTSTMPPECECDEIVAPMPDAHHG